MNMSEFFCLVGNLPFGRLAVSGDPCRPQDDVRAGSHTQGGGIRVGLAEGGIRVGLASGSQQVYLVEASTVSAFQVAPLPGFEITHASFWRNTHASLNGHLHGYDTHKTHNTQESCHNTHIHIPTIPTIP